MSHRVGLTRYDGFVLGWLLDVPGCLAKAPSAEVLPGALQLPLAEHAGWLLGRGVRVDPTATFDVVEEVDARLLTATGGEFCFEADREPIGPAELEQLLAMMRWARDELLESAALPDAILDWEPPQTAIGPSDPWAPGPRTAREVLTHALQLEVYYRGGLGDGEGPGIFEAVEAAGEEERRTEATIRDAFASGRRSWWVTRPGRPAPEEWTLRKVARRMIAHYRVHAAEIVQRRTWVLLGPPLIAR